MTKTAHTSGGVLIKSTAPFPLDRDSFDVMEDAVLTYTHGIPHRLTYDDPADSDGLFQTVTAVYIGGFPPLRLGYMDRYGKGTLVDYEYNQCVGFTHIGVPDTAPERLVLVLHYLAARLHELLMLHSVDPPSCTYAAKIAV
jgi:hypothetical protein